MGDLSKKALTRAESGTLHDWLSLLGLQTSIKLEVVNVPIELFCRPCDLGVRVPFREVRVTFNILSQCCMLFIHYKPTLKTKELYTTRVNYLIKKSNGAVYLPP
jgi:hypothetical protein